MRRVAAGYGMDVVVRRLQGRKEDGACVTMTVSMPIAYVTPVGEDGTEVPDRGWTCLPRTRHPGISEQLNHANRSSVVDGDIRGNGEDLALRGWFVAACGVPGGMVQLRDGLRCWVPGDDSMVQGFEEGLRS